MVQNNMIPLTVKSPKIDWQSGFDKHWLEGSPAKSHAFNALSFLFPQAECYFIDVVREVTKRSNKPLTPELSQAVQGFISQEAVHTSQHRKYNDILEKFGFKNVAREWVDQLQARSYQFGSPLTRLAIVCGYEHYTAILGNYILTNPKVLERADSQLALIWGWHSAEETEHKSVCFDLYQTMGGGWLRRMAAFMLVSFNFNLMFFSIYVSMLRKDGCLKRTTWFKTCAASMNFFFGIRGVGRDLFKYSLSYMRPSFHPWQQDNRQALNQWLDAHRDRLVLIR